MAQVVFMALLKQHKPLSWLPWLRGGSWFVLVSLGLHWAVLQMPIAGRAEPQIMPGEAATETATETIAVVRLPQPPQAPNPTPAPVPTAQTDGPPPPSPATQKRAAARPLAAQPESTLPATPLPDPTPESEATPALVPDLVSPMTLDERLQTLAEYYPNSRAKSLNASTNEFLDWYLTQTWNGLDSPPVPGPKPLSPVSVVYPLSQCLTPAPTPGQLEAIVNSDGSLVREPRVLGSTGYDVLDEKAVEAAARYEFPTGGSEDAPNPTVYWLPVEVVYNADTCT